MSTETMMRDVYRECAWEWRFLSTSLPSATFGGNAAIATVTGQKQPDGLTLDGAGDYVSGGNLSQCNVFSHDFTIEAVVSTQDTAGVIVGKRSGANNGWQLLTTAGPKAQLAIDDGTAVSGAQTSNLPNAYCHLAAVCDRGGNATFYLNGVADGTLDISGSSGSLINTAPFAVGIDSDLSTNPLDGEILLVRLWRRVFTAREIAMLALTEGFYAGTDVAEIYNLDENLMGYWSLGDKSGTNVPDTVKNATANDLTLNNAAAATADGYNDARSSLNMAGSYYAAAAANTVHDVTTENVIRVSAWVQVSGSGVQAIAGKWHSTNNDGYLLYMDGNSRPCIIIGDGTDTYLVQGDGNINDGQWHHVWGQVVKNSAADCVVLQNGFEIGATTRTGTLADVGSLTNTNTFRVGITSDDQYQWQGSLEDVMVWYGGA